MKRTEFGNAGGRFGRNEQLGRQKWKGGNGRAFIFTICILRRGSTIHDLTHYRTRLDPARWDRWSAICYILRSESMNWSGSTNPQLSNRRIRDSICLAETTAPAPHPRSIRPHHRIIHNIGQGQRRVLRRRKNQFAA